MKISTTQYKQMKILVFFSSSGREILIQETLGITNMIGLFVNSKSWLYRELNSILGHPILPYIFDDNIWNPPFKKVGDLTVSS